MPLPLLSRPVRLHDDDGLVAAFRGGRDDAFDQIHDRHRPALERYARRMLAAQGDAAVEDVVQDVLLRAHRALRADDRPMKLKPWLFRIAHNRCLDELRAARPTAELDEGLAGSASADPLAEVARRERLRDVVADVQALPDTQRSALVIRELGGLSYEEMAQALDTTVPAIKSLLVRARMKLADAAAERAAQEERERVPERPRVAPRARPALA